MVKSAREKFEDILNQIKSVRASRQEACNTQQAAWEAEAIQEASKLRPTRRGKTLTFKQAEALLGDGAALLRNKHDNLLNKHLERLFSEEKTLKKQLSLLAPDCEIRQGVVWQTYTTTSSGTYRSQGWGAGHYAKQSAELRRLKLVALGLESRTRVVYQVSLTGQAKDTQVSQYEYLKMEEKGADPRTLSTKEWATPPKTHWYDEDYIVEVKVESPVDVKIIDYRPELPLREQVRMSWKLGINPRVLDPFLPHGYEAEVGIGWHGEDLLKPQKS